jgi:hypothetical protein
MKAKKTLGSIATSVGFAVGFAALASAAPGGTITNTGPSSYNKIKHSSNQKVEVKNETNLSANNSTSQTTKSGKAEVEHNTTGGDATSGLAKNNTSLDVSASVSNVHAGAALVDAASLGDTSSDESSITQTGPDSTNKISTYVKSEVKLRNETSINVSNSTTQNATSGNAEVEGNTTGGNATTGDAVNVNSTSLTFEVSN